MLIPERLLEQMTAEERKVFQDAVAGFFQPTFICAHCCKETRVRVKLSFHGISPDTREKTPPQPKPEHVADNVGNSAEHRVLVDAKESGLFDAFVATVKEEKAGMVPGDLERFFLGFLRTARPMAGVPSDTIEIYRTHYGMGRFDFFQSMSIVGVMKDGVLLEFAPLSFVRDKKERLGLMPVAFRKRPDQLDVWIRGKFGYVPKDSGAFAEAMRQPTVGAFGRIVQ